MRPIVYNGVDLSGVCSAEVIEKVALPVEAETLAVPRRAGALLVAGRLSPRLVRARLFMDTRPRLQDDVRHRDDAAALPRRAGSGGGLLPMARGVRAPVPPRDRRLCSKPLHQARSRFSGSYPFVYTVKLRLSIVPVL